MSPARAAPRDRILHAAVRVFSRDGYESGSLNDVAVEANLSRPNLLYYYPSKRALLLAVLEERDSDLNRLFDALQSSDRSSLSHYVDTLVQLLPTIYGDRELMGLYHRLVGEAAASDHPARAWVLERHRRIRNEYARVIRLAIERGEVRPGLDPDALGLVFLSAIEGIESQWLIDADLDWVAATETLRHLLLALTPPPAVR